MSNSLLKNCFNLVDSIRLHVAMVEFANKQLADKKEITSAFNRHFTTVGPSLAGKIEGKLKDDLTRYIPSHEEFVKFKFKPVTKQYVLTGD